MGESKDAGVNEIGLDGLTPGIADEPDYLKLVGSGNAP
jgi:hypothetical protein